MRILCKTYFDCTATGVTGHYRVAAMPFTDDSGKIVQDQQQWNFSRNQQRNWETLTQLISLRTQPLNIQIPSASKDLWQFEFEVEQPLVYGSAGDFASLIAECHQVPMVINLNETQTTESVLLTSGPNQNIWFEPINNT